MTTTENEIETVAKPLIDEPTSDRLMAQIETEGLELLGPDGVPTADRQRFASSRRRTVSFVERTT